MVNFNKEEFILLVHFLINCNQNQICSWVLVYFYSLYPFSYI